MNDTLFHLMMHELNRVQARNAQVFPRTIGSREMREVLLQWQPRLSITPIEALAQRIAVRFGGAGAVWQVLNGESRVAPGQRPTSGFYSWTSSSLGLFQIWLPGSRPVLHDNGGEGFCGAYAAGVVEDGHVLVYDVFTEDPDSWFFVNFDGSYSRGEV